MKLKVGISGLFIIFVLMFFSCSDESTTSVPIVCTCQECEYIVEITPSEFEQIVFDLTNIEREKEGLPALTWNLTLASAARRHSKDLMLNNYFEHTGLNGTTPRQRMERAGITNITASAENIAAGHATPESVVADWMTSPGHRANILRTNVTHLGVGFVERPEGSSAQYKTYWTQKFCAF